MRLAPLVLVLIAGLTAAGCGQRAARTDLAIAPLAQPVAASVLLDVRPDAPSDLGDGARAVGAGLTTLIPIVSAFAPSVGPTNQIHESADGTRDRTLAIDDHGTLISAEGADALQRSLINEIRRSHAFGTIYRSRAEVPDGSLPTVTIAALVRERAAMRFHHSGLGILYYTPFAALVPHSTYSISLASDVRVVRGTATLLDDTWSADDAYRIHLFYWQNHARQESRTFARTVLADELAHEIIRDAVHAITPTP